MLQFAAGVPIGRRQGNALFCGKNVFPEYRAEALSLDGVFNTVSAFGGRRVRNAALGNRRFTVTMDFVPGVPESLPEKNLALRVISGYNRCTIYYEVTI